MSAASGLTVLSLGAGHQSSALLLMAVNGDLPDGYAKIEHEVFADTGDEPQPVYAWLDKLEGIAKEAGITVHRVSAGRLGDAAIQGKSGAGIPAFLANQAGELAISPRACTFDFKIAPIRRKVRELAGFGPRQPIPPGTVDMLIGISVDEVQRARTSRVAYITNRYPLLELRMRRDEATRYVQAAGIGTPPRSACVFCPYRTDAEWRRMMADDPAGFTAAVDFDEALRTANRQRRDAGAKNAMRGDVFLHRSLLPLAQVDFQAAGRGQPSLFDSECEGICGV